MPLSPGFGCQAHSQSVSHEITAQRLHSRLEFGDHREPVRCGVEAVASVSGIVLIVGAGHAGGHAAFALRQAGFNGEITLIGEEPHAPYQRPPLSKGFLKADIGQDALLLRAEDLYAAQRIALRRGARAVEIDRRKKVVVFDGAPPQKYDTLILATGSSPRPLGVRGAEARNVFFLRTLDDARSIQAELGPGRRLAVIGGGYIGLEVAASARALGAEAVIFEREARCLARVASDPLSQLYQRYHVARGVEIAVNTSVEEIACKEGRAVGVRLHDGRTFACDVVLVGVGALACDALAQSGQLECDGGIVVDIEARTSDEAIFAIGDVTRRPLPYYESRLARLESVQNALEQGKQAVAAIMQKSAPAHEVPWFWSDQYDLKLQIAGLALDADEVVERAGENGALAIYHLKQGVVRAVEAVNAPADFVIGKKLIGARARVNASTLADPAIPLKQIAAKA